MYVACDTEKQTRLRHKRLNYIRNDANMYETDLTYCAFHVLVQTNFRRYYFYFLPDHSQILLDQYNVLDELWGEISTGFDNSWRISP